MGNKKEKTGQPTESGISINPSFIDSYLVNKCRVCGMDLNKKTQIPACGSIKTVTILPNGNLEPEEKVECPYGLK